MPETFIVLRSQTGCESAAEQVRAAPLPLKIRSDGEVDDAGGADDARVQVSRCGTHRARPLV